MLMTWLRVWKQARSTFRTLLKTGCRGITGVAYDSCQSSAALARWVQQDLQCAHPRFSVVVLLIHFHPRCNGFMVHVVVSRNMNYNPNLTPSRFHLRYYTFAYSLLKSPPVLLTSRIHVRSEYIYKINLSTCMCILNTSYMRQYAPKLKYEHHWNEIVATGAGQGTAPL